MITRGRASSPTLSVPLPAAVSLSDLRTGTVTRQRLISAEVNYPPALCTDQEQTLNGPGGVVSELSAVSPTIRISWDVPGLFWQARCR